MSAEADKRFSLPSRLKLRATRNLSLSEVEGTVRSQLFRYIYGTFNIICCCACAHCCMLRNLTAVKPAKCSSQQPRPVGGRELPVAVVRYRSDSVFMPDCLGTYIDMLVAMNMQAMNPADVRDIIGIIAGHMMCVTHCSSQDIPRWLHYLAIVF